MTNLRTTLPLLLSALSLLACGDGATGASGSLDQDDKVSGASGQTGGLFGAGQTAAGAAGSGAAAGAAGMAGAAGGLAAGAGGLAAGNGGAGSAAAGSGSAGGASGAAGAAGAAGQGGAGESGASGQPGAAGEGGAAGQGGCEPGEPTACKTEFVRLVCSAKGDPQVEACPDSAPFCVGAGECVQCRQDDDCAAPASDCYRPLCVAGVCSKKAVAAGEPATKADPDGCTERLCDGDGKVLEKHLAAGAPCGGGVCTGDGACGECVPGSSDCASEDSFKTCGADGHWASEIKACPSEKPACGVGACGGVVQMALGSEHTCALVEGGQVFCWGSNEFGQLGLGPGRLGEDSVKPWRVPDLFDIVQITAGYNHTCARSAQGQAWCWGANEVAQLGFDGDVKIASPTPLAGKTYQQIVAGVFHTCAITAAGTVDCWGYNKSQQTGSPQSQQVSEPTAVMGLQGVTQLALGHYHTCALLQSGDVSCWGSNWSGQLGNGSLSIGQSKPQVVSMVTDAATSLVAGDSFQLAIPPLNADKNFSFWFWGENTQIGLGPKMLVPTPDKFGPFQSAMTMAAGYGVFGRINGAGTISTQGRNDDGRLGAPKAANPGIVSFRDHTLPAATGLAFGDGHTCAWQQGGKAWCWGQNVRGQLGIDLENTPEMLTPTTVAW